MNHQKKIIVIGAGIAGLTCAYYLEKYGYDVTVLESGQQVGGRMATFRSDPYLIDAGAQFLSSGYRHILNLIKELNLNDELAETTQNGAIIKNRKIYSLNYHNPFSLVTSGFLGFGQFVSLAVGSFKLQGQIKNISPGDYSAWRQFDTENAAQWSNAYYGNDITEYLIEPTLEAFYFQSPEETSKALPVAISKFNRFKTITLKSGINTLPAKLAEKLTVELNSEVLEIIETKTNIEIMTRNKSFIADSIVLAVTADAAKKLYKKPNSAEEKLLDTQYSSTVNLAIGLQNKLSRKMNYYGIFVPRKERKHIAAIAIESNKHSGRATDGDLMNVMLSGRAGKELIDKDEKEIADKIIDELNRYIPHLKEEIVFTKIFRWPKAEPFSYVGRSIFIHKYRKQIRKDKRIFLAGDYMGMPFTEGAAETGIWTAKKINELDSNF